jgi:hypothetical protein
LCLHVIVEWHVMLLRSVTAPTVVNVNGRVKCIQNVEGHNIVI